MNPYHVVSFNTDADCARFFNSPIGTLSSPACMTREVIDGVSCLVIFVGNESYCDAVFAGRGGGGAHEDMVAATLAYSEGSVAWCFDRAAPLHGRYLREGDGWRRTGPITPAFADDDNHLRVVRDLALLMQTGYASGHPGLVSDGPGDYVDKTAYPSGGDMTDHVMRLRMRAVNFAFPVDWKLVMHFQAELDTIKRIGTGNGGMGAFNAINAFANVDILGHLGAGSQGLHGLNTTQYIRDSGFVDIDIPFSPHDADWTMMLGNRSKDGHEGAHYAQNYLYMGSNARTLVGPDTTKINSYLMGCRLNSSPGIKHPNTPRPRNEPTGKLFVERISFSSPVTESS